MQTHPSLTYAAIRLKGMHASKPLKGGVGWRVSSNRKRIKENGDGGILLNVPGAVASFFQLEIDAIIQDKRSMVAATCQANVEPIELGTIKI